VYFLNRRYYTLKCYKWKELNDIFLKKIEKALEELYNGFMKLYQMKKKKRKFPGMIPWRM